jgi:predicted ATP-dependent serine protease
LGERVRVAVTGDVLRVSHGGTEVAVHALRRGRKERAVEAAHFVGVTGGPRIAQPAPDAAVAASLLRPLAEYEAVTGGAW